MTHWKLTLAYNGQGFHGWQVQPGLSTVQGTLAETLFRLTGEKVLPQGAGRTDAGVHALGQVASFALEAPLPADNLLRALNRLLPTGIRVLSVEPVSPVFHARHSARGKWYEYRIFERRRVVLKTGRPQERICSPFLAPFVWDCRWPLALGPLQAAANMLRGTHNFAAMAASRPPEAQRPLNLAGPHPETSRANSPNPVKTINAAAWEHREDLLVFRIHGSGFLHHMVRNLVGTMVEIGRGSLAVEDLPRIIASRDRTQAGPTAPAQGLYLVEVAYPLADPALPAEGDSAAYAHPAECAP